MTKKRATIPMSVDVAQGIAETAKLTPEEETQEYIVRYATDEKFRDQTNQSDRFSYEKESDPLRAWHIYRMARGTQHEIPEWVLEYLDKVACGLLNSKNQLKDCALHLGFTLKDGGSSPFKRGKDAATRWKVAVIVRGLLAAHPEMTVYEACEEVAQGFLKERGIDVEAGTVERWYRQEYKQT